MTDTEIEQNVAADEQLVDIGDTGILLSKLQCEWEVVYLIKDADNGPSPRYTLRNYTDEGLGPDDKHRIQGDSLAGVLTEARDEYLQ